MGSRGGQPKLMKKIILEKMNKKKGKSAKTGEDKKGQKRTYKKGIHRKKG